jgi:F0F1-type ATP synthase membrane subunit a
MLTRDQIRNDLLAAYKRRKEDSFVQMLLRGVSDPVKPLSETKRRRFHPLLITGIVFIAVCLVLALWLSR